MKVGIVLSGGGIRGIAHLGVLKALKDSGLEISLISGTSAGSIVGALFAQGLDPYEVLQIFQKTKLLRFIRPSIGGSGLLSMENAFDLFKSYLPHDDFKQLKIELTVTATNFNEGKLVYFSSGSLIKSIMASSCIPGVFKPIIIDDTMYVDGGVMNNFPVEPLLNKCDFIIGSSCNHILPIKTTTSIKKFIERAAIISLSSDMVEKRKFTDILIEPHGLGATSIFDVKKAEEIYWIAYEETLKKIDNDAKLATIIKKST